MTWAESGSQGGRGATLDDQGPARARSQGVPGRPPGLVFGAQTPRRMCDLSHLPGRLASSRRRVVTKNLGAVPVRERAQPIGVGKQRLLTLLGHCGEEPLEARW